MVDDHDAGAVRHAHAHRGIRARGQSLGVSKRPRAQLVEVQIRVTKLKQPRAELILARVAILFDETVCLERLKQTVDGRARQLQPVRDLADT